MEFRFTDNVKTTIGRPRSRVLGSGPNRKDLPNFELLVQMPDSIRNELINIYEMNSNVNFLKDNNGYDIKNKCELLGKIPEKFQHILLQEQSSDNSDAFMELKYTQWTDYCSKNVKEWLSDTFPGLYRTRISALFPGDTFDWHIDTNTSVACRVSCALNNNESTFQIKRRGVVETMDFDLGECVFTNTGWSHRVFNNSDKVRINLLFGIDHKNISKYFEA